MAHIRLHFGQRMSIARFAPLLLPVALACSPPDRDVVRVTREVTLSSASSFHVTLRLTRAAVEQAQNGRSMGWLDAFDESSSPESLLYFTASRSDSEIREDGSLEPIEPRRITVIPDDEALDVALRSARTFSTLFTPSLTDVCPSEGTCEIGVTITAVGPQPVQLVAQIMRDLDDGEFTDDVSVEIVLD